MATPKAAPLEAEPLVAGKEAKPPSEKEPKRTRRRTRTVRAPTPAKGETAIKKVIAAQYDIEPEQILAWHVGVEPGTMNGLVSVVIDYGKDGGKKFTDPLTDFARPFENLPTPDPSSPA